MNINGKVAIVTGASGGIGEATARLFSKEGAKVALVARSGIKLEKISSELPDSFVVVANMSDEKQVKEMVKKSIKHFGRIDILVNNAGQGYDAPVEKINPKTFRYILNLDVVGPLIAMQEVIPHMRRQKQGAIVNISSGTALMNLENMAAYSSAKKALAGISLTAAEELAKDNITVSVVYPYITDTDFEKNTIKDGVENWGDDGEGLPAPPDTAAHAALKILEAVKSGRREVYAHEWMGKPRDRERVQN